MKMGTFLFKDIIVGPIRSRRLGSSLGVNLLPSKKKYCNFNCIYCECGWTKDNIIDINDIPKLDTVIDLLEKSLIKNKKNKVRIDSITFSGNGEPTLHPDFEKVLDNVIILRDKYYPETTISLLSNSTTLNDSHIFNCIAKVENPLMKLDAGSQKMFNLINKDMQHINIMEIVENLKKLDCDFTIQSIFLRGKCENGIVDNTSDEEIEKYIEHIKYIKPKRIMIYPIDRETPAKELVKIGKKEMAKIAERIEKETGVETLYF